MHSRLPAARGNVVCEKIVNGLRASFLAQYEFAKKRSGLSYSPVQEAGVWNILNYSHTLSNKSF